MDDQSWHELREAGERLPPGAQLLTPISERPFVVEATFSDRIVVRFEDGDEERPLWREQFGVLADRLADDPAELKGLTPGVEPYAALLSVSGRFRSDGDVLELASDDAAVGESPHLVPPEEARTEPERVHDDAQLLADLLDRVDATDPGSLDTGTLADLYVLLSDVQRGGDRLRRSAREPLLDRLGPEQSLSGRFGTVRRTTRERRRPKDDETVLSALDERTIPREWVLGVDPEKLDVVLAVTDLEESEVLDVDETTYVQKTGVDEAEKYERLRGLADRIEEIEDGEDLRADLDDLERRLEEVLSAG
jgi:hypothetical protein